MDAQELRNLQEAYLDVYQVDEANRGDEHVTSSMYMSREPETRAAKVRRRQIRDGLPNNASHQGDDKDYDRQWSHQVSRGQKKLTPRSSQTLEGEKNPTGKYAGMQRKKRQGLTYREQADIYDIIFSHLLDEGYAETPEAAEAIMVSMSEEWRESIVDEGYKKLPIGKMINKTSSLAYNRGYDDGSEDHGGRHPDPDAHHDAKDKSYTRSARITNAAAEHNPVISQSREKLNRFRGKSKR